MSNGRSFRHRLATYRRPTPEPVVSMSAGIGMDEHLRRHLLAAGCNCNYEVTHSTDEHGIAHVDVAHDSTCALLRRLQREAN